jgi:hypothetical protein
MPDMPKQMEMEMKIEETKVGKMAKYYLELKSEIEDRKHDLEEAAENLIKEMLKVGTRFIRIDGKEVLVEHVEEGEKIKIRK